VDQDELYDTTGIIGELSQFLARSPDFEGLPRRLKIVISGCALSCTYPEINDIGAFAIRRADGAPAFRVRVGGGLSFSPRFARDLGVVLEPSEVAEVCAAIASVFRDRHHTSAKLAEPYFTVAASEIHEFRCQVEHIIGRTLARSAALEHNKASHDDRSHLGVHRQHNPGQYYIGLSVVGGRTSSSALKTLSVLASDYGSGRVRTTNTQNIVLLDVPERNLEPLTSQLELAGFDFQPSWASRGLLACTGIQFCKLALTETKHRAAELGSQLEHQLALDQPVRISVTGCPNSCGQHHICDVGLEGSVATIDGVKQEAFQVFLGGGVGSAETFGRRVGSRIPASRLTDALVALFGRYKALRTNQESFQQFCLRQTDADLASFLQASELPQIPLQQPDSGESRL